MRRIIKEIQYLAI